MKQLIINVNNSNIISLLSLEKWYFLCAQNIINRILCLALNFNKVYFYRFSYVMQNTVLNSRRCPLRIVQSINV